MANENVEPPRPDLVEYVQNMLNKETTFKKITQLLRISDPRQLKRMMTKALGYEFRVYHRFIIEEVIATKGTYEIDYHLLPKNSICCSFLLQIRAPL